ncbi:arsenic resistance protein [Acidaminobacter sp. JC074]|uniref:arsenic resistance protein n=1 Tax=Acidaminobacter sp. JC074 TaxID=2530199 RepID=UPI001F0F5CC7|nr:bile acid:sodium symporter [Acidaminobacter sp. JC074]MCH4887643.1 arsenic resistance protein [Acidaminobacter sp. JC074]
MFFKKNLMKLVPLTIVMALFIGYYANTTFLKGAVTYVLFLMIYPMMINLNTLDVFKTFQNPKKILMATGINFIVSPLLAILLAKVFFGYYPSLQLGMMVIGLLPTSGMTASWTGLSGGNLKLSLAVMSTNLLLSMVMLPLYLSIFNNSGLVIETSVILMSLLKVVVLPLILGDITRRLILKFKGQEGIKKAKPYFGEISSFFVLVIIFIAVSLKSKMILTSGSLVIYAMVPMALYYIVLMTISHSLSSKLDKADQISMVFSTSMRNLTIALGIVMGLEGGSMAVFLMALAYMIQLPIATYYHHISTKKLATS